MFITIVVIIIDIIIVISQSILNRTVLNVASKLDMDILQNLGIPEVYSLKTPFTAESTGKLWLPGLRAELPSTHTQDTHAGVLAVHRVFLFSICIRLPLIWCGVYVLLCKNSKIREPEEGSSIYIRNISLLQCSFCKCCIPDYLLERGQCSVPRQFFIDRVHVLS